MGIKLRQRTNGDVSKTKWEQDDEADMALANKLADEAPPAEDVVEDVPTLPAMKPKPAITKQLERAESTPRAAVNAKELIETLVNAYMASDQDRVTIEVRGGDIVIEQIVDDHGTRYKNTWHIGIAHYRVSSRKLIK